MRRWLLALALLPAAAWAEGGWVSDPASGCQAWSPHPAPGETIRWLGPCLGGRAHGRGTLLWSQHGQARERDDGQWQDGRQVGAGRQVWPGGQYQGELRDSLPHGQGRMRLGNGEAYEGGFAHGLPQGQGRYQGRFGTQAGEWRGGCLMGAGTAAAFAVDPARCR